MCGSYVHKGKTLMHLSVVFINTCDQTIFEEAHELRNITVEFLDLSGRSGVCVCLCVCKSAFVYSVHVCLFECLYVSLIKNINVPLSKTNPKQAHI